MQFRPDLIANAEFVDKNYVVFQYSDGINAADMEAPPGKYFQAQTDLNRMWQPSSKRIVLHIKWLSVDLVWPIEIKETVSAN